MRTTSVKITGFPQNAVMYSQFTAINDLGEALSDVQQLTVPSAAYGGVKGQAALDPAFSGLTGLAAIMTKIFGGTATILYIREKLYNKLLDEYEEIIDRHDIPFVQESGEKKPIQSVNGALVEAGDLVGIVATAYIPERLVPRDTRLEWDKTEWSIIAVESIKSGNETAATRILAREFRRL